MTRNKFACALSVAVLAGGLAGCNHLGGMEIQTFGISDSNSGLGSATNAQARVTVFKDITGEPITTGKATKVVCVEPSPDVASALQSAMQITADLAKANPTGTKTINASIGAGVSMAESVVQLGERLAVIQLLRDKMYRACEAYANGAITKASYTLLLARLDKTMTTLLSAEMAAGAFGRTLAGSGGTAMAATVDAGELLAAQNKVKDAKTAYDAVKDGGDANKKKETYDAWQLAVDELNALQAKALSTMASANATTGGGVTNVKAIGGIAEIHRAYLNDSGIEPLVDACLTVMTDDAANLSATQENILQPAKNALEIAQAAKEKAQSDMSDAMVSIQALDIKIGALEHLINNKIPGTDTRKLGISKDAYEEDRDVITKNISDKLRPALDQAKKRFDLASSNYDAVLASIEKQVKPFLRVCEKILLPDESGVGGLVANLTKAKEDYHTFSLNLAKVNAVSVTVNACTTAAMGIKDDAKRDAALGECVKTSSVAMKSIPAK